MGRLEDVVRNAAAAGRSAREVYMTYIESAEEMLAEDVRANRTIGDIGAAAFSRR